MKKFLLICLLLFPNTLFANEIKIINSVDFLSLLTKEQDKVIVVNFFASWCPPCIVEMPDFIKIREEYDESELLIIGLSVDENKKDIENFIAKHNINYPVYRPSYELSAAYRVSSIPHTIIYTNGLKQIYNRAGIINYNNMKRFIEFK